MWVNKGSFQGPPGVDTSTPATGFWTANYGTGNVSISSGSYVPVIFESSTATANAGITYTSGNTRAYISEGGVFLARAGFRTTGSTNSTGWTAFMRWGVSEGPENLVYYRNFRLRSFQFPSQAAGAGGNLASEILVRQEAGGNILPQVFVTNATNLNLTDSFFTIQRLARW